METFTLRLPDGSKPGKLILVRPNGEKVIVDDGLKFPNGVTLSTGSNDIVCYRICFALGDGLFYQGRWHIE